MMQRRAYRRGRLAGLGFPVLPDNFNAASGTAFSFSPQTPDSVVMTILAQNNAKLPPDLAAKWAASQGAVTPAGTPVSTQTGQTLTLRNSLFIAPGVFLCTMSDGSQHYCDGGGAYISYTPPPVTPAVSPSVSPVTAPVPPTPMPVTPNTPAAVTPSGTPISTTTGSTTPAVAPAPPPSILPAGLSSWLTGTMIGGVPNWVLLAGGGALLLSMSGGTGRKR